MSREKIQIYFFISVLLGIAALSVLVFMPYLGALAFGATLAIMFYPLYAYIHREVGKRDVIAALLTTVVILVLILTPIAFFGVRLFDEAGALYTHILGNGGAADFAANTASYVHRMADRFSPEVLTVSEEELALNITNYFKLALGWILERLGPIFGGAAKIAFGLFVSLLALYYFLKDGMRLRNYLTALSPLADRYDDEIFDRMALVVNSVIRGTLVVAVIQGVLAGIGFAIFGVPSPVLWGAITVIGALIPAIGTPLVTLPAILYLFAIGSTWPAVGLIMWSFVVVGLADNVLRPKLIERGLHIHPLVILLSVLGGIEVFGAIGFLLGPLAVSLLLALLHIYQREFHPAEE